jgi:hypothetical protein
MPHKPRSWSPREGDASRARNAKRRTRERAERRARSLAELRAAAERDGPGSIMAELYAEAAERARLRARAT